MTGQEALAEAWAAVKPWLDDAAPRDLQLAQRMIDGHEPLPQDVPRSAIAGIVRKARYAPTARQLTTFFGDVVKARHRRGVRITARLATWDYTVFAIARDQDGREGFVSVPAGMLGAFLEELDGGRLDDWLAEQLTKAAAGSALQRWEQTQRLEVFASLGDNQGLVRTERAPAGAVTGDRAGKAVTTGMTTPDAPRTGGGPPWLIIGGLILLGLAVATGAGIGFNLFGGGTPQPTATASEDPCFSDPGQCTEETPSADPCAADPVVCTPETPDGVPTPSASPVAVITPVPTLGPQTMDTYIPGIVELMRTNGLLIADGDSDWEQADPEVDPDVADIEDSGSADVEFPALGEVQCPMTMQSGVICADAPASINIAEGQTFHLMVMEMRTRYGVNDSIFLEGGIAAFDPTPPGGLQPEGMGGNDFLTGNNIFYSVRLPDPALSPPVMFRLVHDKGTPFLRQEPSSSFAFIYENKLVICVPIEEWGDVTSFRGYQFFQAQPSNATVSDTAPNLDQPQTPYDPNQPALKLD
jgi:hypothetical protein